jgi:hypothetical protein
MVVLAGTIEAQTSSESSSQRQLRNDRERFQREVDRQRNDAKRREENTRNTLSDIQTADDIERLRARQATQQSSIDSLNQRATQPSVETTVRSSELSVPSIQHLDVSPDFAITFLADGRCVIHRKGRLPEVHTAEEAQALLKTLLDQRASKSAQDPAAKTAPTK